MIDDFLAGFAALAFGALLVVMAIPNRGRPRPLRPELEPESRRARRAVRRWVSYVALALGLVIAAGGLATVVASLLGIDVRLTLAT